MKKKNPTAIESRRTHIARMFTITNGPTVAIELDTKKGNVALRKKGHRRRAVFPLDELMRLSLDNGVLTITTRATIPCGRKQIKKPLALSIDLSTGMVAALIAGRRRSKKYTVRDLFEIGVQPQLL